MSGVQNSRLAKTSIKPGFGQKTSIPKSLSLQKSNATSTIFNQSSLRSSVSDSITNKRLNTSFSSGFARGHQSIFDRRGSNFVAGTHLMGVSDYKRDRNDVRTGVNLTSIGYDSSTKGYRSGRHDLELMTGMTQRSERRMLQRMGMVDLGKQHRDSGHKTSFLEKIGIVGGTVASLVGTGIKIADLIKGSKSSDSQDTQESDISKLNKQQGSIDNSNDSKVSSSSGGIASVSNVDISSLENLSDTELQSRLGELNDEVSELSENKDTISSASDKISESINQTEQQISDTNTQITQTNSQITQSKNTESTCLNALNDAQKSYQQLLDNPPGPEDSTVQYDVDLEDAKNFVETKQQQYFDTCRKTMELESNLAKLKKNLEDLNTQSDGLESD